MGIDRKVVPSDWPVSKSVEALLMIDEGGLSKQSRTNPEKLVLCFIRNRSGETMESYKLVSSICLGLLLQSPDDFCLEAVL